MTALRYRIQVLYCLRAHAAPYRIHFRRVRFFQNLYVMRGLQSSGGARLAPAQSVILVTGGTGFIGQALVQALAERGQRMAVLTRDPARLALRTGQIVVRQGDVLDPPSLVAALEGVTTVVHLAAALPDSGVPASTAGGSTWQGREIWRVLPHVATSAQFVHGSSAGVYGDGLTSEPRGESSPVAPRTRYEESKLEAERAIAGELSGPRWRGRFCGLPVSTDQDGWHPPVSTAASVVSRCGCMARPP